MAMSDKARSILVFAAYHQLSSGERVRDVVLADGAGHKADSGGVAELEEAGLLTVDGDRGRLSEAGEAMVEAILEAVRAAG
ncbi:hypothetical protein [Aurantimonas sp. Leaf443]|uniref:hypothetical protein n=1 Tax=Aurantimonas sp. Leaf443 TaxID=1736378 RepID=UPI0006FC0DCF|nr:hypothetical protein [Aurantimonas sp. Leaf443]KQT84051.1 hypothetical protein ASG48_11800 [Aurantimonas sp. Leaf443]